MAATPTKNRTMTPESLPRRCRACDRLLDAGEDDVHERCKELAAKAWAAKGGSNTQAVAEAVAALA